MLILLAVGVVSYNVVSVMAAGSAVVYLPVNGKISGNAGIRTQAGAVGGTMVVFGISSASTSTSSPITAAAPTPTPTPPAAASDPGTCPLPAYPNASCTGIPAATVLTFGHPAHVTVTTSDTVIDGWDIAGGVEIRANNVTIRNSRVRCAGEGECIHVDGGLTGVVVSHNDIGLDSGFGIDPQGMNVFGKGAATSVAITANNIHNVGDGIRLNGAATVQDNYIHGLDPNSGHGDGMQAEEGPNVIIRHNTIGAGNTSSILVNNGTDENNWVIDSNLFIWADPETGVISDNNYFIHFRSASCPALDCYFTNNVITHPFPAGTRFVANAWPTSDDAHWYGNVFSDGGIVPLP